MMASRRSVTTSPPVEPPKPTPSITSRSHVAITASPLGVAVVSSGVGVASPASTSETRAASCPHRLHRYSASASGIALAHGRREQLPDAGHAAQGDAAQWSEREVRARREVAERAGRDDVAGRRLGERAGGDMDADAADVAAAQLHLAGVDGDPEIEPDGRQRGPQAERAAER